MKYMLIGPVINEIKILEQCKNTWWKTQIYGIFLLDISFYFRIGTFIYRTIYKFC